MWIVEEKQYLKYMGPEASLWKIFNDQIFKIIHGRFGSSYHLVKMEILSYWEYTQQASMHSYKCPLH